MYMRFVYNLYLQFGIFVLAKKFIESFLFNPNFRNFRNGHKWYQNFLGKCLKNPKIGQTSNMRTIELNLGNQFKFPVLLKFGYHAKLSSILENYGNYVSFSIFQ